MLILIIIMIRTYGGKLIKVDKSEFKNDYDYYRFMWNAKYKIKINSQEKVISSIKKLVK